MTNKIATMFYLSPWNGAGQGGNKEETQKDCSLHLAFPSGAWSCDSEELIDLIVLIL